MYLLSHMFTYKIRIGYDLKNYDKGFLLSFYRILLDMKTSNDRLIFVFYLVL